MDNDGFISNGELFQVCDFTLAKLNFYSVTSLCDACTHVSQYCFQVLKMMVGNNLKDTQLQQIVDKTILFADKDEDGKISFDEFCAVSVPRTPYNSDVSSKHEAFVTLIFFHLFQVVGNTDIHKKMVVDV